MAFAEGVAAVRPKTAAAAISAYRIDNPSISLSIRSLVEHHHIIFAGNETQHLPALLQCVLVFLDLGSAVFLSRFRFHRGENERAGCGTGFFLFVGARHLSHDLVALHRLAGPKTIRQHVHGNDHVVTEIGFPLSRNTFIRHYYSKPQTGWDAQSLPCRHGVPWAATTM